MFHRIYYDRRHNKIHLWESEAGGKVKHTSAPYEFRYWVEDTTGKSQVKDIYGTPMSRVRGSRKAVADLVESGVKCAEADIAAETKFLHDRYEDTTTDVDVSRINVGSLDIEVAIDDKFPTASLAEYPINLISVVMSRTNQVYVFATCDYTGNDANVKQNYFYCADEQIMLKTFATFLRRSKIDILTGWNVTKFDITYIVNRCKKYGIEEELSPLGVIETDRYGNYVIAGIHILDYMELYKKYRYVTRESYSLNYISKVELGEGKKDLNGTLNTAYKTNWNDFVEYNVQDARLVQKLENKLQYIALVVRICHIALIPFDRIFSTIAMHVGLIMCFLHKTNRVLPNKNTDIEESLVPGAYVYAAPGMYENVVSFDVTSLYPHMIMMYNIGPETLRFRPTNTEGLIPTPLKDVYYVRGQQSVLSEVVTKVFTDRKMFQLKKKICGLLEQHKTIQQIAAACARSEKEIADIVQAIENEGGTSALYHSNQLIYKIIANSLYGACACPSFHLFNPTNATAITQGGQDLIKYMATNFNTYFREHFWRNKKMFPVRDEKNKIDEDVVKLVDTDSSYVCLKPIIDKLGLKFETDEQYRLWVQEFIDTFLQPLIDSLLEAYAAKFGVKQIINFKREKIATRMMITGKKHYAINVIDSEGEVYSTPKMSVTGIEIVKTDTPLWAREELRKLLASMMAGKSRADILHEISQLKKSYYAETQIERLSELTSVNTYEKYALPVDVYLKEGLSYPKGCPKAVRASMNYNYIIAKYKMPLQPITSGTKVRFVTVDPRNKLAQDTIAFINNWPAEFDKMFTVDRATMWKHTVEPLIQSFFDAMRWGEVGAQRTTTAALFGLR